MQTTGKSGRILMLLENCSFPEDRRVAMEVESLVQAGFDLTVISKTGRSKKWSESVLGAQVYRYPATWELGGFLGYLWEYAYSLTMLFLLSLYVLVRRGFDAVHVHTPPDMTAMIAIFYRVLGKKFVFDHHDLSPELYLAQRGDENPNLVYKVLLFFERLACRNADRLIATNESQKRIQVDRCGASPERCHVVRNGPHEIFLREVTPRSELRSLGKSILGFVGVIGVQDGVDQMVRVLKELKDVHGRDDFLAVIVGNGSALPMLKQLAAELGVDPLIQFTGPVPFTAVPEYVASFDICFTPDPSNPYNDSCTTVKTMEYMALGKPTVCFRTRENELTAGDAALYADNNDVSLFARLVNQLMDDEQQRREMGAKARQKVEDELAWKHQADRLIKLYDDLFPSVRTTRAGSVGSSLHEAARRDEPREDAKVASSQHGADPSLLRS